MKAAFLFRLFSSLRHKSLWGFVIANLGFGIVFFFIWQSIGFPNESFVFETFDAKTYKNTGDWIFGRGSGEYVYIRPFFYPLFISILMLCGGAKFVFVIQTIFWFLSANLTMLSLKKLTDNAWFMLLGGVLFVSELTSIVLCGHALTESIVLCCLSIIIYMVTSYFKNSNPNILIYILLFLSILAVIKPIFLFSFVLATAYLLLKKHKPIVLLFCSLPILMQVCIYTYHTGKFGFSDIGKDTFKQYYFAEAMSQIQQLSFDSSRVYIRNLSASEMVSEIYMHPRVFTETYLQLLKENIDGDPVYFTFPQYHEKPYIWAKSLNHLKYYMHILLIIPLVFLSIKNKKTRWMGLLLAFILLNTGLSFKQGDRLVSPSVAVWAVLYGYIIYLLIQLLKKQEKTIAS